MLVRRWRPFVGRSATTGVVAVLLTTTLAACGPVPASSGAIQVVGAENEYANVAALIGGPYVHTTAVLNSPFVDPHEFEACAPVASAIANARIVVQNGMGYDNFMSQLESATSEPNRKILVVQQLV